MKYYVNCLIPVTSDTLYMVQPRQSTVTLANGLKNEVTNVTK